MAEHSAATGNLLHLNLLNFLLQMEGESAASVGDPVSSDPYADGTLESDLWLAGWTACRARKRRADPALHLHGDQLQHR